MSPTNLPRFKYAARDSDNELFAYTHKPVADRGYEYIFSEADEMGGDILELSEFPGSEAITFNDGPKEIKVTVEVLP